VNVRLKFLRSAATLVGIFLPLCQVTGAADSFSSPSTTPDEYYCLSLVAGFPQSWLFVMSKGFCVGGTDHIFVHTDWPKQLIAGDWDKGFHITNVAGDKDGWVVVMNDASVLGEQLYFGPGKFPGEAIAEKLKARFSHYRHRRVQRSVGGRHVQGHRNLGSTVYRADRF
jgi:hypothetical protein